MSEEFLYYKPEIPLGITPEQMVESKTVLPVNVLLQNIQKAYAELITSDGLNLGFRQIHAPGWLGWWNRFLREERFDEKKAGRKLLTIDEIAQRAADKYIQGIEYANLFANGMEGHEGHRQAIDWMLTMAPSNVRNGLLLDYEISPHKERSSHYLPLEMRLSMWAYYQNLGDSLDHISLIPDMPAGEDIGNYYDGIFRSTGARYHFVGIDDPHLHAKLRRNGVDIPNWVYIQYTMVPPTTDRTERFDEDMRWILDN